MTRPARRLYRKRIKRRIYKKIPSKVVGNSLNVNCEYFDVLRLKGAAAGIGFWNGFQIPSFRNIKDMLLNSQSYLKFSPLYGKLRINSIKIMASPVHSISKLPPEVGGLPLFFATFYPNFTSAAVDNAATLSHDTSLVLDVVKLQQQHKTYRLPLQFYEGSEGTGYGVDFDPGKIQSLSGEIHVAPSYQIYYTGMADLSLFNFTCIINISFSDQIW